MGVRKWKNGLWYAYNDHLTQLFGERVYRVTVSAGMTCPVRDGTKGTIGCTFCDERGSSSYFSAERAAQSVEEQLRSAMPIIRRRFHANKFLAYFQSFTNTYAPIDFLKSVYDRVTGIENVLGMSVGTRPDCVGNDVIKLLHSYTLDRYVSVELGLQSFSEKVLKFYQRRHTAQEGIDAIKRIRKFQRLEVTVHLMFGAPGETKSDAVAAARAVSELGVNGVKIHQLMVLKGTVLARIFEKRPWPLYGLDEYNELVRAFLENLDPSIHVERTHALVTIPGELIGPTWSAKRFEPINRLKALMAGTQSYHGKKVILA